MAQPLLRFGRGVLQFIQCSPGAYLIGVGSFNLLFEAFLNPELKAGDRIRTGDVQLGKLTFYH